MFKKVAPVFPVSVASLDMEIGVGFGRAGVTCDGVPVWTERPEDEEAPKLAFFENLAHLRRGSDWRVILYGPLRHEEWQRWSKDNWVLIKLEEGFA